MTHQHDELHHEVRRAMMAAAEGYSMTKYDAHLSAHHDHLIHSKIHGKAMGSWVKQD